ncbi:hypothetical protein LTR94_035743, partial [Friedmanniomyces endolithicus]
RQCTADRDRRRRDAEQPRLSRHRPRAERTAGLRHPGRIGRWRSGQRLWRRPGIRQSLQPRFATHPDAGERAALRRREPGDHLLPSGRRHSGRPQHHPDQVDSADRNRVDRR